MTDYFDLGRLISPDATGLPRRRIVEVLTGIAEGRRQLPAVRHPLGFRCLPLLRRPDTGICVHVWASDPAAATVGTSGIHSHSWDLTSTVLYGEIRNRVVQVVDSGTQPTYRVFEIRSSDEGDEILATSRLVRLAAATTTVSTAGEVFELAAGEFHRTGVPPGEEVATFVVARTRPRMTDLSLGGIDTPGHRTVRQRCTAAETAAAAGRVAGRLAGAAL
jgi:hypothetical protein